MLVLNIQYTDAAIARDARPYHVLTKGKSIPRTLLSQCHPLEDYHLDNSQDIRYFGDLELYMYCYVKGQ